MPIYQLGDKAPKLPTAGNYWVAPDVNIIGDVEVGENVGIWFGVTIRGDNETIRIGAGTNIQEGVVIHSDLGSPATIGENCTIGHSAIVHGCTIGNGTLVGMGATVLNGAKIGNNCLIGANALVTEGKEFPDGSLIVGSPAKAIRQLDDASIAGLQLSAQHYIGNWQRFAKDLKKISD